MSQNICRACLTEEGSFQSVFQAKSISGISLYFSEMLSACATIQVNEGEGLTEQICSECSEQTVKTYLFKLKCEKSDMILRKKLKKSQAKTLKEIVQVKIEAESDNEPQNEDFHEIVYQIKTEELHIKNEFILLEVDHTSEIKSKENIFSDPENDIIFIKKENPNDNNIYFDGKKKFKDSFDVDFEKEKQLLDTNLLLENNPHSCDICLKGFSQASDLENHKETHNNKKTVVCATSGKELSKKKESFDHLPKLRDKTPATTSYLESDKGFPISKKLGEKKLTQPASALNRKKNDTGEKLHECKICNKKFTRLEGLKNHKKIHKGEKSHECDICKKKFRVSSHLVTHRRIHTGEKPYECDVCKKKFARAESLSCHKITHTGERPECDICKKKFSKASNLTSHKKIHTGEISYECDTCNKKFTDSHSLKYHKRLHLGEKPYECDVCKKKFACSSNLTIHKRIHTGEKPYGCDMCNKKFAQTSGLKYHKKTTHT